MWYMFTNDKQDDVEMLLRSNKVLRMFHFCIINVKSQVFVLHCVVSVYGLGIKIKFYQIMCGKINNLKIMPDKTLWNALIPKVNTTVSLAKFKFLLKQFLLFNTIEIQYNIIS